LSTLASQCRCEKILVLDVRKSVSWTSYFCLATFTNSSKITDSILFLTKQAEAKVDRWPHFVLSKSEWEVLDYGEVVVHLLTASQQEFYKLEGIHSATREIILSDHIL
jgi:ribosomal silencing factor RsfS